MPKLQFYIAKKVIIMQKLHTKDAKKGNMRTGKPSSLLLVRSAIRG